MSIPNIINLVDIETARHALLKAEELMSALRSLNTSPNENVSCIAITQMEAVCKIASELSRVIDISEAEI